VAEIAAFIFGVRIDRQFDGVELEAGIVGVALIADVVEHEELGLGAEEDGVADAHRFDHGLGLLGDAARVAIVGLARGRLEHVADQTSVVSAKNGSITRGRDPASGTCRTR
jgi:hypothetical protein